MNTEPDHLLQGRMDRWLRGAAALALLLLLGALLGVGIAFYGVSH